jgi:hypothetical protein
LRIFAAPAGGGVVAHEIAGERMEGHPVAEIRYAIVERERRRPLVLFGAEGWPTAGGPHQPQTSAQRQVGHGQWSGGIELREAVAGTGLPVAIGIAAAFLVGIEERHVDATGETPATAAT